MGGDERVAWLIQAARELIDAYERQSTANEHFLKLEAAVDAVAPAGRHEPTTTGRLHRPRNNQRSTDALCIPRPGRNQYLQGSGGWLEHRTQADQLRLPSRSGQPADRRAGQSLEPVKEPFSAFMTALGPS